MKEIYKLFIKYGKIKIIKVNEKSGLVEFLKNKSVALVMKEKTIIYDTNELIVYSKKFDNKKTEETKKEKFIGVDEEEENDDKEKKKKAIKNKIKRV